MNTLLLWKDFEEVKVLRFDFSGELEAGQTITLAERNVTLTAGVDATPEALLLGDPLVLGTEVLQRITAGAPDATYHIRARATDGSGLVHVMAADLLVVRM